MKNSSVMRDWKIRISSLIATIILATTVVINPVTFADDVRDGYGKGNYGFEDEAPNAVPLKIDPYPYPVTKFELNKKSNDKFSLSLELADKAELSLIYGSVNKKDGFKEIKKSNSSKFENVIIPLVEGENSVTLKLENERFMFSTVLLIKDGVARNVLTPTSDVTFIDKKQMRLLGYETEPNDTPSTAINSYSHDDNYGTFYGGDTVDYWKFNLTYRAFVNFYLGNIQSGSDYDISVYRASDMAEVWKGSNGGNSDELGLKVDLQPGTYYIKVAAYSNPRGDVNYNMRWRIYQQWPVLWSSTITQGFSSGHEGLDISYSGALVQKSTTGCQNPDGNPPPAFNKPCYEANQIAATYDGVVQYVNNDPYNATNYGRVIYIVTYDEFGIRHQTRYGHLYSIASGITLNGTVRAGQIIGTMGNTGRVYGATGTHLHFETNQCVSGGCTTSNSSVIRQDPMQAPHFPNYF